MARVPRRPPEPEARRTQDVMAFGQEIGRVLSDRRIVGRAEPFTKVFPSSRAVKRAVGPVAWTILEDIALDATLDERGRLVADTNVRRIAANLGINKDTATKHLARLREYGFVLQEEARETATGRWEAYRYVLDPSACLERFTVTPAAGRRQPGRHTPNGGVEPRPKNPDTVPNGAASEDAGRGGTGPGEVGHKREEEVVVEQQQTSAAGGDTGLMARLVAVGVEPGRARQLTAAYPSVRIAEVLAAAGGRALRNPAGWVTEALDSGWDLIPAHDAGAVSAEQARERATRRAAATRELLDGRGDPAADDQVRRAAGWSAAIAAALDDTQLAAAVEALTTGLPAVAARSVPLIQARLTAWAADVHRRDPDASLSHALSRAIETGHIELPADARGPLPPPPAVAERDGVGQLPDRLRSVLSAAASTRSDLVHDQGRNLG